MLAALLLQRKPKAPPRPIDPWGPEEEDLRPRRRRTIEIEGHEPEREAGLRELIDRIFEPELPASAAPPAADVLLSAGIAPAVLLSMAEDLRRRDIIREDDYLIILMAVAAADAEGWL